MHHDHNLLTIRVLTIASIMLAVVAGLSMFEANKLDNLTTKKVIAPSSSPSSNSDLSVKEASSSVQITGPGNCVGIDQCLKYCQDHPSECAKKLPDQK